MDERAYRTPLQPAEPAALVAQPGRLADLRGETLAWSAAWLVAANVVYGARCGAAALLSTGALVRWKGAP